MLSSDHPSFVCNKCETNVRAAVKIRNDIREIEKCWKKYIDEMHLLREVKIEEVDDDSVNFETVEMIIEPVDEIYNDADVDYTEFDSDSRLEYDDDGAINNYSISDLDDSQDDKMYPISEKNYCEHFNKKELTQVELKLHQQSYHPEMLTASQFKCDICKARYSSRHGIRTHMKRHMQGSADGTSSKKIKRYKCSSCDERFSKKVLLVEHELRHSGVSVALNFLLCLRRVISLRN